MKSCVMAFVASAIALGSGAPALAQALAQAPAEAQGKDPPGVNPTHFQCYQVKAASKLLTLKSLRDQFGVAEKISVTTPIHLCVPTAKNGVEPKDPRTHYLCYQDKGVKPPNRKARITNQFGDVDLAVLTSTMLCVPSLKKLLD